MKLGPSQVVHSGARMASPPGKMSSFPEHASSVQRSRVAQKRWCCASPPNAMQHPSRKSSNIDRFVPTMTTITLSTFGELLAALWSHRTSHLLQACHIPALSACHDPSVVGDHREHHGQPSRTGQRCKAAPRLCISPIMCHLNATGFSAWPRSENTDVKAPLTPVA